MRHFYLSSFKLIHPGILTSRNNYILQIFGLILCLAPSLSSCTKAPSIKQSAAPEFPIRLETVSKRPVSITSEFVSTLKSRKSVLLKPQVSGQITAIYVRSGDLVKKGSPILQIDPEKQEAVVKGLIEDMYSEEAKLENARKALNKMEANRKSNIANLELAKTQYLRYKDLQAQGAVAAEQVDVYTNKLKVAENELKAMDEDMTGQKATIEQNERHIERLKSSLKEQQTQLSYYRIVAPFSGMIGDIPVKSGDYVSPLTGLTTISQPKPLEVYLSIPAEYAQYVSKRTTVELIDNSKKSYGKCNVFFISPTVDPENQTVLIKANFDNKEELLRDGQQITGKITWDEINGITIPTSAVNHLSGRNFVFVCENNSESGKYVARQKPVELGEIQGSRYYVKSGLKEGEKLIISGIQNLSDGINVIPQ